MFNDEYLEYWGTMFVAARLLEQGIPFQEFLEDPWGCLKAVGLQSAPLSVAHGYEPLLPRQVKVAQTLWRRWETESYASGPETTEARPILVTEKEGNL